MLFLRQSYFAGFLLVFLSTGISCNVYGQMPALANQHPQTGAYNIAVKGKQVGLFVLRNNTLQLGITNLGARIVSLIVPDRNGTATDVVLGFDSATSYLEQGKQYFGATVGRYANRIARGRFTLDGVPYQLDVNNGVNSLHGGKDGFFSQVWNVDTLTEQFISLSYFSRDGEQGYPGNLNIRVSFRLRTDNAVVINYSASTDKKTIVNFTNHAFYNLNGAGTSTITDHVLTINAARFTPVDSAAIPTGELRDVTGTAFDFRNPATIGARLQWNDEQLRIAQGFDHNFVLGYMGTSQYAAMVTAPRTGITLRVYTTEPGMQFYDGHKLNATDRDGKGGVVYTALTGFCLETQHFPDSPNHQNFPTTELDKGSTYTSTTVYAFGTDR